MKHQFIHAQADWGGRNPNEYRLFLDEGTRRPNDEAKRRNVCGAMRSEDRKDLVVAVECMFAWYWLAELCRRESIAFILGHALNMKAVHGTKTKYDREDGYKIARNVRGGNFPAAYPLAPPGPLIQRRAELLTHLQNTVTRYNLPPLNRRIACKTNREGVAQLVPNPIVLPFYATRSLPDHSPRK